MQGQPNAFPDAAIIKGDWSAACIALSIAEIRAIFVAIPLGTEVEVRPWANSPQERFHRANNPKGRGRSQAWTV